MNFEDYVGASDKNIPDCLYCLTACRVQDFLKSTNLFRIPDVWQEPTFHGGKSTSEEFIEDL